MGRIELTQARIEQFDEHGEKTSWCYIAIPAEIAQQIHSTDRKSFRGKGYIDELAFEQIAVMPIGEGDYILPVNATMRKSIRKQPGEFVNLVLEKDLATWSMHPDLEACLSEVPDIQQAFVALPVGHQRYFSDWIGSTKNPTLRADRIAKTMYAVEHGLNYGEMIRHFKSTNRP